MSKNYKKGKIVACLDMGSSKLVCIIASISGEEVRILGYGHKESKGITNSVITDMRLAQKSITNVVSEAERMAGFNIDKLLVGISGSQTISNRKEISGKIAGDVVNSADIGKLADRIRADFKGKNREIIHLIPLQYCLDGSSPVSNPRYMSGEKISAKFHVISTAQTTIKNIENCLKRCQLSVNNYIVEPYASSLSTLTDNEMNLGTLMIDVGGSSTSFAILSEGKLIHVGNSPIGGSHITKDISIILNIGFDMAEKIKNLNNSLMISPIEEREIIKLKQPQSSDGSEMIRVTRIELKDIIQSRVEEIFESVKATLEKSHIPVNMLSNIVISGGVTSTVGIDKLASEIFKKNVRVGYPTRIDHGVTEISSPAYSCSVGMLIFLRNLYQKEKIKSGFETKNGWFKRMIEKLAAI